MNQQIDKYLDICIVTYNRAEFLKRTLEYLRSSILKNCNIYVLDNCSTDNTPEIINQFGPNVKHIRHRFNIGGNANILRAYETGENPYVWVLGDDDEYNLNDIEDLINIFQEEKVDLIHVGAHVETDWSFGGKIYNTRELVNMGYHFFKYSSFIGCNIIKRSAFKKYIIPGYRNIVNSYPHMPYLLSFFEENKPIYISHNQISKAVLGNQGYNHHQVLFWWGNTSKLLKERQDQIKCFFDQYQGESLRFILSMRLYMKKIQYDREKQRCILSFFSIKNKAFSFVLFPLYRAHKLLKPLFSKIFNN